MRSLITLFIILSSCAPYKRVNQLNMTNPKANRIAKKFNFTQPHKSYSDKATRKRAYLVGGHNYHRTY